MSEKKLLEIRINNLRKWRKEICNEFDRWPMFYSSKWFIDQMYQIDSKIELLENI